MKYSWKTKSDAKLRGKGAQKIEPRPTLLSWAFSSCPLHFCFPFLENVCARTVTYRKLIIVINKKKKTNN